MNRCHRAAALLAACITLSLALVPVPARAQEFEELLEQLDDEDYDKRTEATRNLLEMARTMTPEQKAVIADIATRGTVIEVKFRARLVYGLLIVLGLITDPDATDVTVDPDPKPGERSRTWFAVVPVGLLGSFESW